MQLNLLRKKKMLNNRNSLCRNLRDSNNLTINKVWKIKLYRSISPSLNNRNVSNSPTLSRELSSWLKHLNQFQLHRRLLSKLIVLLYLNLYNRKLYKWLLPRLSRSKRVRCLAVFFRTLRLPSKAQLSMMSPSLFALRLFKMPLPKERNTKCRKFTHFPEDYSAICPASRLLWPQPRRAFSWMVPTLWSSKPTTPSPCTRPIKQLPRTEQKPLQPTPARTATSKHKPIKRLLPLRTRLCLQRLKRTRLWSQIRLHWLNHQPKASQRRLLRK